MMTMSNFEEFAQTVGRDVKRFETDYTSKADLEAKDYIEGKSEYQILKHQVEELVKQNKVLQEQLALVKPAPRRAPMAYTIDLNSTPPIAWFDNGCGLDVGGNPVILGKDKFKPWDTNAPGWDFPNAILRTSLAMINLEVWKKANFDYWGNGIKVLNPIKSADDYDWTNARLSEQGNLASWKWNNQKNVIRVMYQFGIWDAKTVESLGAVRR
ncbi:hypothetical protein smi_0476 [Streptococcus mitis B6]|uniref:Uncharacterized protein n=2 Tax=Streptococcus mitis TaxID=28037 RepID=D3H7A6_STRM6|nr:hypothetical protein smi_0476 [Streptococcus mitis B6]